jgi:predicted nucleic acid-binding protein
MTQYVDSSAFAKRFISEPETPEARRLLMADLDWVSANHTYTETYRAISLGAREQDRARYLDAFEDDWSRSMVVILDDDLCRRAAEIAVATQTRTLDALHLAAAEKAGGAALHFLTFDIRQSRAARSMGWTVLGV